MERSQHTLQGHYLDALKTRSTECPCLHLSVGLGLIYQSSTAKGRRDEVATVAMVMFTDKQKGRRAACPRLQSQDKNALVMYMWAFVQQHACAGQETVFGSQYLLPPLHWFGR